MTLKDLEPLKYEVLIIFAILIFDVHFKKLIATKWLEIDQVYLHIKF